MPEHEAAVAELRKIGGVKVTAADAPQVYPDHDLVWPGLRHGPLSEHELALCVEQNRWHHLSHSRLICSSCAGSAEDEPAVDAQLLPGEGRHAI